MPNEVFPHPLVKEVAFEIKFPSLFFLDQKIGEYQVSIMDRFPDSEIMHRRSVLFATGIGADAAEQLASQVRPQEALPVWRFKSRDGIQLDVTLSSLSLSSTRHKTYNLEGAERFREVISQTVETFLTMTKVPTLARVGLRYINRCPVPAMENQKFREYYATAFPLDRFPLERSVEMDFKTVAVRGDVKVRYVESIQSDASDEHWLIVDIDAWAENIKSDQLLAQTDGLHDAIVREFEATMKQPIIDYMRKKDG